MGEKLGRLFGRLPKPCSSHTVWLCGCTVCGCFPVRELSCEDARFVGAYQSEEMVARMRGLWVFPRTMMMQWLNVFGLTLLYKTGISTNYSGGTLHLYDALCMCVLI